MWERTLAGKDLRFHLSGINNENFIMKDEQTGSWWQQVSGYAIQGPMRGTRLKRVAHEDVTFATWRKEHPSTRVLEPDPSAKSEYASADWEVQMLDTPVVTPRRKNEPLGDRALVAGVALPDGSRAYPMSDLARTGPVNDRLGSHDIVVMPFEAGNSVRVFDRKVEGQSLEFYAGKADESGHLVDASTGTTWDLTGVGVSGPLSGRKLEKLTVLLDYWFDWKTYHPDTDVYRAGL